MKLIMLIARNDCVHDLLGNLTNMGLTATKLASTGGFLKQGNTTLLIGLDDEQVNDTIDSIKKVCKEKVDVVSQMQPNTAFSPSMATRPVEAVSGGATIFVLNVEQYHKV